MNFMLHKFYAASISIALDGSMLVTSTGERILIWGMMFCFIAALSLGSYLFWRTPGVRRISLILFIVSLSIPVFIIPAARHEYIHVSRNQITIDTGSWHRPSTTVVALSGLQRMSRESNNVMISNLMGDPYVTWYFERNNGSVQHLRLNDFFSAHSMTIAHYIRDRGYQVEWLQVNH